LASGTLAPFAARRPELQPLMKRILDFDVNAQYLLTEVAHGLDAPNLETIATLLPNGEFDLHTPNDGACKYMPPTGPFGGIEKVAIVFARLVVNSEDRGVRPFVVPLSDGVQCCQGISIKLLPQRGGIRPVDHAITRFTHVRLPSAALLGTLKKPTNFRANFMAAIWRVSVGSLALSTICVPFLSVSAYTLARYSMRRVVTGPEGPKTIWSFRTQHGPILHALAQSFVMQAQAKAAIALYTDKTLSNEVRSGVATAAKASMMGLCVPTLQILGERSGAHGMFEHNKFLATELGIRGSRIAEGDVLVLCIRLANELILGRYELPKPRLPDSPLARHELGIFSELQSLLRQSRGHRSEDISGLLLPRCTSYIEAIGYRMAYEAAISHGIDKALIDLYEIYVIMKDSAWFSENLGLTRWQQIVKEEKALSAALPSTERYLQMTGAEEYVVSPIVTERSWEEFVKELPVHTGNARINLIRRQPESTQVMARL